MKTPKCKRCNIPMVKGVEIQYTFNFDGKEFASKMGKPEEIPCWKCSKCGRAIPRFDAI